MSIRQHKRERGGPMVYQSYAVMPKMVWIN
jgi:hypothetical protein